MSLNSTPRHELGALPQQEILPRRSGRPRFKPQLSCTLCRVRKLKCDRNQPCGNCTKRNMATSCTFIHAGLHVKKPVGIYKSYIDSSDVHGRIQNLESLVVSFMQQTVEGLDRIVDHPANPRLSETTQTPIPESDPVKYLESLGRISIDDGHPNYVGSGHWTAILQSISGLKDSIEDDRSTQYPEDIDVPDLTGPELLVGGIRKASRTEILSSIPSQSIVDRLVNNFHRSQEFTSIVHAPTFREECVEFWANTLESPVMWIGLLFSVMAISLSVEIATEDAPSSLAGHIICDPEMLIKLFRERTVQCLILADYTQPSPYAIETLLLHLLLDCFSCSTSPTGSWMLIGLITRAAMRLGLHRDASHYPNISVFKGEMQRRHWALIEHMDLHISCQIGLPRNIREGMFDTKPPRNLYDQDMDRSCTSLPPSRSYFESTPIRYPLMKSAISRVYGIIVDRTNSILPISYNDIMTLDSMLNKVYLEIPASFRVSSLEDLRNGTHDIRVQKFSLDLCYQRARCVLHRRYISLPTPAGVSPYRYSVRVCIDAAVQLLQSQAAIYRDAKPGGELHNQRWKLFSLMTHDFFQAAMLICLYLSHTPTLVEDASGLVTTSVTWSKDELLTTLEMSQKISEEAGTKSKDSARVAKAMKLLLFRLKKGQGPSSISGIQFPSSIASPYSINRGSPSRKIFQNFICRTFAKHFTVRFDGMDSSEFNVAGSAVNTPGLDWPVVSQNSHLTQIPQSTRGPHTEAYTDRDWELWDKQFQSSLLDATSDFWIVD